MHVILPSPLAFDGRIVIKRKLNLSLELDVYGPPIIYGFVENDGVIYFADGSYANYDIDKIKHNKNVNKEVRIGVMVYKVDHDLFTNINTKLVDSGFTFVNGLNFNKMSYVDGGYPQYGFQWARGKAIIAWRPTSNKYSLYFINSTREKQCESADLNRLITLGIEASNGYIEFPNVNISAEDVIRGGLVSNFGTTRSRWVYSDNIHIELVKINNQLITKDSCLDSDGTAMFKIVLVRYDPIKREVRHTIVTDGYSKYWVCHDIAGKHRDVAFTILVDNADDFVKILPATALFIKMAITSLVHNS